MMVHNPQHTVVKEVYNQSMYTTQEICIRRGTPLGVLQATCRGAPLHKTRNRGWANPSEVTPEDTVKVQLVSAEMDKQNQECLSRAATEFLEELLKEARTEVLAEHQEEITDQMQVQVRDLSDDQTSKTLTVCWAQVPATWRAEVKCFTQPLAALSCLLYTSPSPRD